MKKAALKLLVVLAASFVALPSLMADEFPSEVVSKLESMFSEMASRDHVVNAVALVDANGGKTVWQKAHGLADPVRGEAMTTEHQFRTASVTKSFTGTLVLQLIEEKLFELDTPVHEVLSSARLPRQRKLKDIHRFNGESLGERLTVRHLLNHSSGLPDYWFDQGSVGDWEGRSWLDLFEAEAFKEVPEVFDPPSRLWTPNEVLQFYYEVGLNIRSHFPPGKGFLYSDTNYLLLGMIVEDVTGKSLAENYRQQILEPLGIENTYKEYREKPTAHGRLAHHFWYLRDQNLDVVELQLASSAEWANGGQVTTVDDLRTFIRGLFAGKLFKKRETLSLMTDAARIDLSEPQKYFDNGESTYNRYSCGLKRWDVGGVEVWGHTGFWGIGMFYIPSADVSIAFAKNQVTGSPENELRGFVKGLQETGVIK